MSTFLSVFVNFFKILFDLRTIFFGNTFLSKNTILSTSLRNITFLSASLSISLSAFPVERFLSAFLSTYLSAFFVEHFFECFFEHSRANSRYFGTLLIPGFRNWWFRLINQTIYPNRQQKPSPSPNVFLIFIRLCKKNPSTNISLIWSVLVFVYVLQFVSSVILEVFLSISGSFSDICVFQG